MSEKYIAKSTAIAARMLGGEMMIMSAVDSTFFTLNPVATIIWQAADGRTPLSEIVTTKVCEEFDVEPEAAERDAEQFVSELSEHGILLVSENPILESPPSQEPR
jgi:Coenzyme PQQ synthesis protein D (PqqD)